MDPIRLHYEAKHKRPLCQINRGIQHSSSYYGNIKQSMCYLLTVGRTEGWNLISLCRLMLQELSQLWAAGVNRFTANKLISVTTPSLSVLHPKKFWLHVSQSCHPSASETTKAHSSVFHVGWSLQLAFFLCFSWRLLLDKQRRREILLNQSHSSKNSTLLWLSGKEKKCRMWSVGGKVKEEKWWEDEVE